jgi:hypothetical protein
MRTRLPSPRADSSVRFLSPTSQLRDQWKIRPRLPPDGESCRPGMLLRPDAAQIRRFHILRRSKIPACCSRPLHLNADDEAILITPQDASQSRALQKQLIPSFRCEWPD